MKNMPETVAPTVVLDRISTREELFEVIEMLCNGGRFPWSRTQGDNGLSDGSGEEPALEDLLLINRERLN